MPAFGRRFGFVVVPYWEASSPAAPAQSRCLRQSSRLRCLRQPASGPTSAAVLHETFAARITELQQLVCSQVEEIGRGQGCLATFAADPWTKDGLTTGRGETRVLEDGVVFEKAAVNVSVVSGNLTPERATAMRSRGNDAVKSGDQYSAAALSMVIHPRSPLVPTLRGDVRVFTAGNDVWWAGGGADLTPVYLYEDDVAMFHEYWRDLCDKHQSGFYDRFKPWCDSYFFIPSRSEHRGVGGIFFDDLSELSPADTLEYLNDVAKGWIPSYEPIVSRRGATAYTDEQRQWQLLRRGRYLEFNLLYDRGVRFGLQSSGRTESIMVSAPPLIRWSYNVTPSPGSEEAKLLELLQGPPRDWVS